MRTLKDIDRFHLHAWPAARTQSVRNSTIGRIRNITFSLIGKNPICMHGAAPVPVSGVPAIGTPHRTYAGRILTDYADKGRILHISISGRRLSSGESDRLPLPFSAGICP
jgi:hypothetical protein